jgi:hypothetical protein
LEHAVAENDFYADGEWNFACDLCGRKQKSNRSMLTWNGLRVCRHHKEVRNPQDFLRGVKDDQSVPWSRSALNPPLCDSTSTVMSTCTLQSRSGIPGFGLPGCMTPGNTDLTFTASLQIWTGWAILDTSGCPIFDTSGQMIFPPGTPTVQQPFPSYAQLDINFYLDQSVLA